MNKVYFDRERKWECIWTRSSYCSLLSVLRLRSPLLPRASHYSHLLFLNVSASHRLFMARQSPSFHCECRSVLIYRDQSSVVSPKSPTKVGDGKLHGYVDQLKAHLSLQELIATYLETLRSSVDWCHCCFVSAIDSEIVSCICINHAYGFPRQHLLPLSSDHYLTQISPHNICNYSGANRSTLLRHCFFCYSSR